MDRPKRPFFSLKTTKKDESSSQDKVPTKKSFKDKVDFFEKSNDSKDSQDAAVGGEGLREGSGDETFEQVLEERDVYTKDGRKKGKMVIVNMITVHKSVKAIGNPEAGTSEASIPAVKHSLSSFDREGSMSRSSSRDSLSSPSTWRKSFVGTRSQFDLHIEEIKNEQERVQKKTFVNWINSYLSQRIPPLKIDDLIEDLKDGTKLLALLEVLSGERLAIERGRNMRRPHFLSNVNSAIQFLQSKRIKLVNINSADIVDGRPPIVLGLIWTIILYFQIEENTKGLSSLNYSFSGSTSSLESIRSPTMEINRKADGAKKTLLKWVGTVIPKESNIKVKDFGPSWRDGIAFLTIIDTIQTNLIDMTTLKNETNRTRLETAFNVAEQDLGITRLLDPEDVDVDRPDERSVMTYVAQFVHKYPEVRSESGESIDKIQKDYNLLLTWLIEKTQHLSWSQNLSQDFSEFSATQDEIISMSHLYNRLKKICNSGSSIGISVQSWKELEKLWTLLDNLMKHWQWQLDLYLPEPFKVIGEWITKAEQLINDNNIPSIMNEETAVIISKKLEDHKKFFADLPEVQQKFNELLVKTKNQNKEVNDLSRRLNNIEVDSHKRRTHLKFLEHKCCLIAFLSLTENKLKAWTVKYGRHQDVLQLLEKYNNFVIGNNIFQEFNKAFIDMQNVVQEYKHECRIEYKEAVAIEKFMRQTAEQWKSIAMELRCAQSMLEEVISYWRRWKSVSEDMKAWLADAVEKINLPHEQRIDFFQDIGVWKEKYELLNDTVSFLIATCEDLICAELKQEFQNITTTWESIFLKAKDYMHSGDMIRNRKEFLEGLDTLHKWNIKAEQIMSSIHLSSSQKIKDYLSDIQNLQTQLDQMDDLFKTISKKFQVLIKDLTRDEVNEMMLCVKKEKESLVNIRASIPVQLNALHHMLVQYDALETGQQEINHWLNNCEEFLSTLKLSKNQNELHEDIDYLKSIIVRMSYYQSMLSSKNKIFQSIIKSIQPEKDQGNNSEFVQTMADLNAKFSRITQECQQWDMKLQQTLRCWHNFIEIEKVIQDWIETSKQIFLEEQTSSRQNLESQKGYFEYSNNNKWISELENVEGELLRCILPSEQETIKNRSKAIKLKYQECLSMVPAYIKRVEFKLNEITFNQCINEAEKELNIEQQMFNRNENVNLILRRNIEYFDNGMIIKELKSCLNNMSVESKKISNPSIDSSLNKSINRFESIEKRTAEMRQKCKQIPNQFEDYKSKFNNLEKWMDAVDVSVEKLLKGLLNDEEFEFEKSIFQEICRDVDSKRDDMKWMVQVLDSLLPYVSEKQQQVEQKNLEELIGRYKHLIPTIDMTITKTEMYTKCFVYKKEVTEIGKILEKAKDEQLLGESWDDLSELIKNQEQIIERLEKQRIIVMSTLQRGKQLVKNSSSVPNFIPQLVSKLETDWSSVYNDSIDKFNKLKNAQRLLIDYTKTKNEVMEIIKKAENELKTVSDDNKHNSKEISMQLRSKQELSLALREAAENMLNKLRDISQNLHIPEKEFAIENEINIIENKLVETIQTVDKETQRLEKLSMKLCELDSGLNKIHVWSVESAPAVIERIQQDQTNPEIKARGIEEVQDELQKQRNSLERLTEDLHSFEKESDTNETQKLRQDLDEVRMSILNLECNTNRKNEEINIDLNEWQVHKAKLEEIRPWLENVEKKINTDHVKPITLQMANDWLKTAQLITLECQEKIENLKTITSENKTAVILNEVDAIQSRCISIQSSAVQQTTRLQRLLLNWKELNEKAQKIEEKLNQPLLSELKELIINQSISEDLLEKKLMEHKALTQELNECLSEISSLSQNLNGLNQHFSLETTSDIKEKLSILKTKNNEYLKLMHGQMLTISNIISEKKEHKIKVNMFCEWLNELDSKVNKCNIVPSTSIEEILKKLHTFSEEHMEKQSLFIEIEDDFKHFNDNASIQQSIMQYKELQDLMQKKKIVLEKANEFFIWNETLLEKLKHAEFQFDTNQDNINLINDISACSEEVELWTNNIDSIEHLLQQSKTTIPGLSVTDQFNQLKFKLAQIQEKLKAKEENEQKVKDCQKVVSEINDYLVEQIKVVGSKVNDHVLALKSWTDIALIIPKLHKLKDTSELFEQLKTLEKEGEILTQLDKSSSIFVQNILLDINAQLINLKTITEQSIENLTELNNNWLNMNDIKNKIKTTKEECKTILELIETPNDLTEAQVIEEKYNKALKQTSALLDVLPVVEESMHKMVTLAENYPQLNVEQFNQIYKKDIEHLEKYHADLKENAEIAHSQQVIWKQVNQTKDTILQWLSDVNIELLDCTNNFDNIEKIKNKLVKYSEEKELNLDLKDNLVEKINKLQKLNKNKPIITLDSLSILINDQFNAVESIACNLVRLISAFTQREEAIRTEIKKRTSEINQIRENVSKCDNLNNELDTLLINLKSCQKCKTELIKMNLNIDTVNHSVSEMTETFPIIAESTAIKELKSLKKRYESVVQQVDKVETTLMTYLKKHLEDDLNNLLHSIKSIDEKLTWCKPEEEIEKEQIEIKLGSVEGIKENLTVIKEQKCKIDQVLEYLNQYSSLDLNLEELSNNDELLSINIENTEKQIDELKVTLEKIISFWVEYQNHLDNILPLVNVLENDIKLSVEIPIDMNSINIMEENVNKFQFKIDTAKQFLNELESCVQNIKCIDSKSTLDNQVIKVKRKLESYQNSINKCLERIEHLKEMKKEFNISYEKADNLIKELSNKFKSIETTQPVGKKSVQNAQSDLGIMKNLNKQLEESQQLVNDTVSKGECMYPDITMENRDEIRFKVKQLRLACENLNDECGNITKSIENVLVQKSSFDESCSQIKNWLHETEEKLIDYKRIKKNNIIEKKTNCNNLKTLKQDLIDYKDNINQLKEKVTQLNEPDTDLKLKDFLKQYDNLALGVNKCLKLNESHLKNHELYLENVEIFKNYLKVLQDEYSVAVNNLSEIDVDVFINIIDHKSEGELILKKCNEIGNTVLKETDVDGKNAIQNELDEIKINWESLMLNCENTSKMLSQKQNQNDEILTKIENLDKYLKSIETQIKDRSLKNSLASKQQYLEKLKQFDEDITKKHKEILEIQSNTIEVSPNVNSAITNLIKTYQNVKTKTKESILRYDNFVREHQQFNLSYEEFIGLVNCLSEELNQYSEVVGDLGLLQARQKKLLALLDSKCQQSVQYESLVNMAEKLYVQTSPDGREMIRQNMKDLRNSWELVSDTLQCSLSKLDNCLLQFAEFSLSQEQLTKWLKNIEQAMQQHTETKATLQEKKAQLQNHVVINQEILSHQNLVQSVCDKAQELVNQTKDSTLNTYLESIKNLYEKIVTKSKELMDSLELSVQNHSEFNHICQKLKLMLKEQRDKIRENDSIAAEKENIVKRINILKEMKTANTTENELRNHLEQVFQLVCKTTTKKGINVMSKEISKIDSDKSQIIIQLDTIIEKMEEILIQWTDFENEFDEITIWFRSTESLIKDQQLQSTFENKENKLKLFTDKRNEILNYEPKIEKFIDNSNNLLHTSGVERLKPLILQVGNRYQLILVLSKEMVAKWQNISDAHKNFNKKLTEFESWLETLESKPAQILDDDDLDLNKKLSQLQSIYGSSDQTSLKISLLTSLGESLYPDTSAAGREIIRKQLKDIRDRWDTLDEKVKTAQKTLGVQSQQWNSYQETLLQTINWLEGIEKVIASNQSPIWSSPQEIRSKLLKQKATMQEINSHSRMIETIIEKGKTIKKPKDESDSDMSLKDRYDLLRDKMNNSISQLENYLETYQQYQDLHKSYHDTQKQLWDQLSIHTDYSGNKQILESRLNKVNIIQTTFNNNKTTLLAMERFVEGSKDTVPQKAIDTMLRDHTNLQFEQEKFQSLLNDLLEGLQSRINQWAEFENLMHQLISWHNDTEKKLQNYSEKGTLEEKTQQYNKFQDLEKEIKGKSNSVKDLIAFGDHLQQSLVDDMKNKVLDIDKLIDQSNEYKSAGEARLSTKVKQISSRYQSMETTIKDILNKCNESIKTHQEYVDKYNECSIQLSNVQSQFKNLNKPPLSSQANHQYLIQKNAKLNELLDTKPNVTCLLNSCMELGEKLYLSTSTSGRENIKCQLDELQTVFDTLYDDLLNINREVKDQLTRWSGFEEIYNELNQWFNNTKQILNKDLVLKSTLDEKKMQLQIYREMLQAALKRKQDIVKLQDLTSKMQMRENNDILLSSMSKQHNDILKQIQDFVDKYEAIVKDHEQYTKSVMEMQEWLDATHNTLMLWGDTNLEKISLLSNLDRIKNLLLSLNEEENRIYNIQKLAEKVIPGTIENGQVNIRAQIDSSQQDWEGLMTTVKTSIEALENKLNSWNEFDVLKESCLTWLRETDYKIHAIDLKNSLQEKKTQLEELKDLQGVIRAKEFEIDSITEKSQNLYTMSMSTKNSQITEIVQKFHQLSMKIKELVGKWQQFLNNHLEFESSLSEAIIWLDSADDKLTSCTDFKSTSKADLEEKLIVIQDILLYKDDGFNKVQNCIEIAQIVLANTAPEGHKSINESLTSLQEHWSSLATKMIETKTNIDESIQRWSGFLEHVKQEGKIIEKFEDALPELEEFQGTMSEKRDQLEKLKHLDEKVRCEKLEMDSLKLKAHEMLKTGHQSNAVAETQEVFNKFDQISDKVKKLLNQREQQYKDHKTYKEAYEELSNFLNRSRDKIPSLKERPLSDKLAIENAITPLETLLNKRAQGELLLDNLNTIGGIIIASTSENGEKIIKQEISSITDELNKLFDDILTQKDNLHAIHTHWREYKDEYEKLSDWLQQIDISMKAIKNTPLATVLEKTDQVKQIQDVLDNLEKGKSNIERFNESSGPLLKSHLETYVNNQLRHLNSRYEVQVNLAKDVQRKVETNLEHHLQYENYLEKAKTWINDAKEAIRCGNETTTSNTSKEVLQSRLDNILELLKSQEEGQLIIHSTVNSGEKVLRSTRSDGKDLINNQLKEIQVDWDRLVKKIATSKVHLETSLLQWADYNSSYSHLEQWISDREAKLDEVCELKVSKAKKNQVGFGSLSIGERKATLRRTNSIVQDIVSFEPMIQKVTLKAEDLQQAVPANEITNKYHTLSIKAKDLYERQKETVRLHQEFIDAGNDFATWLRSAKERVSKISEPTGDKEMLSAKSVQFKVLQSELPTGQNKLEFALERAEKACSYADEEEKEIIEQEVVMLQEEFDIHNDTLQKTKALLEDGIYKWNDFDDYSKGATEWLNNTEKLVQSYNKLQPSLEGKKEALEEFQTHLQTLFDWQKELDILNGKAQVLLETCSDTRLSNSITQMTTKYNTLLSLAKEVMRRLELHYQEHQQHNSLYQECLDWLERTRDKLNECEEIPNSLNEVKSKLQSLKVIRQTLEQGQNRLRYIMELKEKVVLSTEPQGAVKIEEDTENLRQEFDKLSNKIQVCNNNLTLKVSQLEELEKCIKILNECLDDISSKINGNDLDQPLNNLSEKKTAFEKLKSLLHELNTHNDLVNRLSTNIENKSSSLPESITCVSRYNSLINMITNKLLAMENQVAEHEAYRSAFINVNDWLRKTRIAVQSCADTHGDYKVNDSKITQLKNIEDSSPSGEAMIKDVLTLIETLKNSTGPEGCDKLNQDKNQLNCDWDELKHFIKEVQSALNKCAKAWDDFNVVYKALKDWETDLTNKVNIASMSNEAYTPDDLDQYKLWLQEIINQNLSIEELTDRCESLMELSACNWVRDDTLKIQSSYTTLLTTTQGLVSKAEKSLTDHTEFIAAKEKVEEWLNRAHGTVQDCIGEGDLDWVKDKLQTVHLVSSRITEGQYLMNGMQEVFTKALNNTLAAERNTLVNGMEELNNSWNSLNIDLNSVIAHLKSLQARWEENNEAKDNLEKWLSSLESKTTKKHDFRADVGEMKTLLERLNYSINEIDEKETDFNHIITETEELSKFCKNNNLNSDIKQLKTRKNILKEKTLKRIDSLESEISQHSNYLQALQESEKWLLQISFQLMAHNSLYITNRQQTQEQIRHHQVLLNEIIQYQEVLDDLKSKGKTQIERYVTSTPTIQTIVEQQLSNIQDSYNSLFNTAQQIKSRLEESLLKFKQYEDMLESIWSNLDDYQPFMNKTIDDNWSLTEAKEQLAIYRDLLDKLQGEKTRLALAVQACEAAVASISRPSSPVESTNSMIPEQEIAIRLRLEENLDQVQNFVDELVNMISILENKHNQRAIVYEWIEKEIIILNKMKEKPTRINIEATTQEITNLNEMLQNVNDKKLEIAQLVSDDPSDKLVTDLDNLIDMINQILQKKQSDQNLLLVYKNSETDLQNWFDNLSKCIESLEKGSGNTCLQKLVLFNSIKEDYINNGEKLINSLRSNCQNLREVVSISDAQLLDDQMKSADRRYRDFWTRMERKYEIIENSKKNLLYATSQIEEINSWIDEKSQLLDENNIISYDSNNVEKKLIDLKNINKEAETKQVFLTDSLTVKLNAIELESEPIEYNNLEEKLYKPTINKLDNFKTKINEILQKMKNMHEASLKFENSLTQCNVWLDRSEKDLSPDKYKLEPLELIVAEKNVEKILNFKTDIQCFKDGKLSDLEKNSQVLSNFCDKNNISVIQSILNDVLNKTKQIDNMSNIIEEKSKSILENRKNVENNVNICQQWFSEVEVIMSADVRLSSLNIVEDQLQKYDDLNKRSSEIDQTIEQLKIISEQMVLCEPDTLKISDQILSLENSQKRTKAMIKDRIEMIGQYLEKMKSISKTVEESKKIILKVESNLQELDRPVGSTMDDVKDMINSYEVLLKELKHWNDKLSDNDNESLIEIVKQQEDLINTIEKQLSKLRQLLHLHEQFMTLIADIVMFLTKYSSVVNEIGKSGNTIQNKIKQFDEVTVKIQECEATLLLATDKGERIAEVGSAFDHNNITQQLQSLKQQLLTLRKAVEKERQKLEATAAEHIKLASDLEQVLDWIRENEALIKSRPLLEININSVETDLKAHEELKVRVDEHLSRLKTIHSTAQNETIEDSTMLECLSEANSFLNTIPKELQDRQTYLNINKDYRIDYEQLKHEFTLWINEAKQKLKSVEENKPDYTSMISNLEHLQAFFGDKTIHDLVTKKIKNSIDKIRPSLTSQQNDVLTAEQREFNKDLEDVMNSAKVIQKNMEDKFSLFKEYKSIVDKVSSILDRCKYNEDPIQNLAGLYFNVEKITLVQNDLFRQQAELDLLLNKSKQFDANDEIQSETDLLTKQWSELEKEMSSRIMLVTGVGEKWKNFEDENRKIETDFTRIKDTLMSVDQVIRSKDQLVESLVTLRKLKENLDVCGNQLRNIMPIGESVLNFLISESHPASSTLKDDIESHCNKHESLANQLNHQLGQFEVNLNDFTQVEAQLDKLELSLNNLKPEVEYFYVFAQDIEQTQKEFDDLSEKVKEAANDLKKFIECTQNNYISLQKLVPNDLLSKFNPLELVSEELTSLMDSNSRGLKRAKTIRTEYVKYIDDVQRWLQEAEVKVQDRGSEPKKVKEHIQTIEDEISAINDKLNKAIKHGNEIVEKTKDEEEKEMIPKTIESLVGKMSQVKFWLDEKRSQIGDTLDAWQKFLSVYDLVMAWCQSKTNYLEEPITLSSLEEVKQKAHEFSAAVKSSKQQSKHLAEMSKELDIIALSTDVGHLPEKLEEANNAKNDVEGKLSEKNALLHETCEEWEQFERKLKEVKLFIEKSQNAIESAANKKRTLREQHDLREKMLADITIQRKKITLSTEKLQIHFRAGFGGSENIEHLAKDSLAQLDKLFKIVEEQAHNLEESLLQLDKYQQEIQHLRQKVITAEQQLRLTQSPTYLPHDRQKAMQEQNAFQEQIRVLQSKINSRTERIKLIIQRGSPISDPLLN